DARSGEVLATLDRTWRTVTSAAFSPDGSRLAIGAPDETCELWDWRADRVIATHELREFVFSGDGAFLAGVGPRDSVDIIDAVDGERAESLDVPNEDAVTSLALDFHARRIAVGTASGIVHVWPLER